MKPTDLLIVLLVFAAVANAQTSAPTDAPSPRVHIFYYDWYGTPRLDGAYMHWTQNGHIPPADIASNYYPVLGPYSSSDPAVLRQHMQWIRSAGVGVLTLSWWGRGSAEDRRCGAVLDAAARDGLMVNFHLEPYGGSTPASLVDDVRYILHQYGKHPAFYRDADEHDRPMFYIFETLRRPAAEWRAAIAPLRGTPDDAQLIAQTTNIRFVVDGGFDGGYTYDVLTPFTRPSFYQDWQQKIAPAFRAAGKRFIPSVGPGYWDDRAVPNGGAHEPPAARTRDDGRGDTYIAGWRAAAACGARVVTITSFNEWHEGTQIEPAVERSTDDKQFTYPGYGDGPLTWLGQTAREIATFERSAKSSAP